ncbi:MAG: ATP-binding protein [Bacillota bacterium]
MIRWMDRLLWWVFSVGGIRLKVMGIVLTLALVLGAAEITQARTSLIRLAHDQLSRQAVSLARDVAARATDQVLTHDLYGLRELLNDTVSHNPDLKYAVIYDDQREVLDSTFGQQFPVALLTFETPAVEPKPAFLTTGDEHIYDVVIPMFEGRAGFVRVGLSDQNVNKAVWSTTRRMLLETLAIASAALISAFLLTLLLTRPLEELMAASRAVTGGDLSRRAHQFADDEIGQLTNRFNRMIEHLQRSQEELLRQNRVLTVLNAVAEAVTRPLNREQLLADMMRDIQATLGLGQACIYRFTEEGAQQPIFCTQHGRPHLCSAPPNVRRLVGESGEPLLDAAGGVVPLVNDGRVIGVFCFTTDRPTRAEMAGKELFTALGRQMGMALENIRLWEELKVKEAVQAELLAKLISAQEEERKLIAMELHDETGQLMTSLMVNLKLLETANSPDQVAERLGDMRNIASTVLDEIHSLALQLRPPVLDHLGLIHALDRYTRDFSRKHGIKVELQAQGFERRKLPVPVGTTLYRITQEALTNVARHSRARSVSVTLKWHRDRVTAIINDDGIGFDVQEVTGLTSRRLGMFSMQERAKLAGGQLEIRSEPGQGTTILARIPALEESA